MSKLVSIPIEKQANIIILNRYFKKTNILYCYSNIIILLSIII